MKTLFLYLTMVLLPALIFTQPLSAQTGNDIYTDEVTFPANFVVGDYVEFLKVQPDDAGASGYYEISISYTRGNIAAAATHVAAVSHSNPDVWRETGRINNNGYIFDNSQNFTVDVNPAYGNARFRIRAINTFGIATPLTVHVKIRSININYYWGKIDTRGNDLSVNQMAPMTSEWNLFVGNPCLPGSGYLALRATGNGDIGIGTANPQSKLAVAGTITAQRVKVTTTGWPDYVFTKSYALPGLQDVASFITKNGHLPEIPSASAIEKEGQDLGEMNKALLKKVEELTLYMIAEDKKNKLLEAQLEILRQQHKELVEKVAALLK